MPGEETIYFSGLLLSLFAGSAIFLGALLGSQEQIAPHWLEEELQHTITAIGAGALLAAIALILVPEGIKEQGSWLAGFTFIGGGCVAMAVDQFFANRNSTVSQMIAMMLDFIPETIIIGTIITKNYPQARLLTALIFVQNLPESFNAFREMKRSNGLSTRTMLLGFFLISLSGPLYVYLGVIVLADQTKWLAMLMTFCAGGILYLVFNDIAPQVPLKRHRLPAMGALFGFLIGMIGYQLTQ